MPPQRVENAGCFFASHSVWKVNVFFCLLQHHSGIFLTPFHIVIELFKRLAKDKTDKNGNDNIDKESADTTAAGNVTSGLGSFAFDQFVNYNAEDLSQYGLDKPYATITVDYQEEVEKESTDDENEAEEEAEYSYAFICPNCGQELEVDEDVFENETELTCPACGNKIPIIDEFADFDDEEK